MSDLPKGWSKICFDDICEIARGGSPRPIQEYLTDDPEGINWIKISDATQSDRYIYKTKQKIKRSGISRSRIVKDGDFILSNSMSFGRPYIVKTEGCIHDGWLVLSINSEVFDQDYLYYFLSSQEAYKQFDSKAAGSTVRNLNIDIVKTVEALIPPLAEQKRIVTKLDSLFAHTRRARQELDHIPKLIERYKQAILSAAFRGDLTADWRKENNQDIDKTWKLQTLGELIVNKPKNGYSVKPVKHQTPFRVLTLTATTSGKFNAEHFKYFDEPIDIDSQFWLQPDDILIQRGNTIEYVGVPAIYDGLPNQFIFPDLMIRVRANSKTITKFLYIALSCEKSRNYLRDKATGTAGTMPKINQPTLISLPISLPSLDEQKEIVKRVEKSFQAIDRLEQEYQKAMKFLDRLEQSTLAKAFRGEIVPQDPNDEPASILLERIQKERENQQTPKKRQLSLFKEKT